MGLLLAVFHLMHNTENGSFHLHKNNPVSKQYHKNEQGLSSCESDNTVSNTFALQIAKSDRNGGMCSSHYFNHKIESNIISKCPSSDFSLIIISF